MERTVVLIKPDGVKRGLVGEIISRFERRGLKIISLAMLLASREEIDRHYPKDKAWVANLGSNTIKTYEKYESRDAVLQEYGTDDTHEIGKMVREWLVDFLTSGPIVKMVVEGTHAIDMVRKIVGPTIPAFAEMGTIRGDFSVDSPALANRNHRAVHNLIHASGNPEEAKHELAFWFTPEEIHDYKRVEEDIMF
ncbi:MAG: nucleoside-diphosphate kinase [bacterium]|nr:nucleoside-diphosphate kinase [bacterium]